MSNTIDSLHLPELQDKRRKITATDRLVIAQKHYQGMPIRELAREYPCSRRLIQFICYPERAKMARKRLKVAKYLIVHNPRRIASGEHRNAVQSIRDRKKVLVLADKIDIPEHMHARIASYKKNPRTHAVRDTK